MWKRKIINVSNVANKICFVDIQEHILTIQVVGCIFVFDLFCHTEDGYTESMHPAICRSCVKNE